MRDVVIRAEGLGKKYFIGHRAQRRGQGALRDALADVARNFARSARDLAAGRPLIAGERIEEFWALKDVDFEIERGEVIGVVGRNGAGKSTLLKILSRITEPSAGRVEIRGRVASLLEVGAGFHPELSGRENIHLNGAILGMTRAEIRRRFDEIVAFAEIGPFLDTAVKRYSSGMYVRLAFAVAAHLEPEILIVDEVLAVGDAQFQKKCLGKMSDVASAGRTVLFVSHQLGMIAKLCRKAFLLSHGAIIRHGPVPEVIDHYTQLRQPKSPRRLNQPDPASATAIVSVETLGPNGLATDHVDCDKPLHIRLSLSLRGGLDRLMLGVGLDNINANRVATWVTPVAEHARGDADWIELDLLVEPSVIAPGLYFVTAALFEQGVEVVHRLDDIGPITFVDRGSRLSGFNFDYGCVVIPARWRRAAPAGAMQSALSRTADR